MGIPITDIIAISMIGGVLLIWGVVSALERAHKDNVQNRASGQLRHKLRVRHRSR